MQIVRRRNPCGPRMVPIIPIEGERWAFSMPQRAVPQDLAAGWYLFYDEDGKYLRSGGDGDILF